MKYAWMIMVSLIVCASPSEPCQWNQYLGNPGRTAYVTCNGPDSFEILWRAGLEGELDNPTIFGNKAIVFGGFSGSYSPLDPEGPQPNIAVIDLLTGEVLQRTVLGKGVDAAYPLEEDRAIGDSSHYLYEVDIISQESHIVSGTIPGSSLCGPLYYPVILSDKVVFPTTPVVCISKSDYRILWTLSTSLGASYPKNGRVLNIAASENRTYIIIDEEGERRIWAMDSTTGSLTWVSDASKVLFMAVEEPTLFVGGDRLCVLDAQTGELLWESEAVIVSNMVVGSDTVYFADFDNHLHAVDKATGKPKWETQWKEVPHAMTYLIGAGNILILSNSTNLYAFSTEDGTQLWGYHFYSEIEMCAATSDGIVVVGEKNIHELIAFASDPELFVKQGDAFLCQGLKEKAGDSYRKAVTLYEKKGNLGRAGEIKKKISELGFSLETQPPTPSASPSSSVQPSPEPPPLTKKSALLIASIIAIVVFIIIITYYFVKRKQNKQNKRS